jgi:lysophospholipase L1-like esterase
VLKKTLKLFVVLVLTLTTVSCSTTGEKDPKASPTPEPTKPPTLEEVLSQYTEEDLDSSEYELDKYTIPYWEGNIVYNESVLPLENEDGSIDDIPLLYKAEKIIAVHDATLRNTYVENVDYELVDGKLRIKKDGDIKTVKYSWMYPANGTIGSDVFGRTGGGYIRFGEGDTFHKHHIVVTYVHIDGWKENVPQAQGDKLPKTLSKLENKEPLNIVFFGDSITVGANSSKLIDARPGVPRFSDMMVDALKDKYGYDDITFKNTAVGGQNTAWGADTVYTNVIKHNPDLLVLAFGMNDAGTPPQTYKQQIQQIIDSVLADNPDCEIILVATMLPNEEVQGFYGNQYKFADELKSMTKEGIALCDMTEFHSALLKYKRYYDMTGNNVNHPNDFLARAYTQVLLQTMSK